MNLTQIGNALRSTSPHVSLAFDSLKWSRVEHQCEFCFLHHWNRIEFDRNWNRRSATVIAMLSLKCGFCGIAATMKCGGCKTVFYCGKEHQKLDWKKTHKSRCKSYSVSWALLMIGVIETLLYWVSVCLFAVILGTFPKICANARLKKIWSTKWRIYDVCSRNEC